VSINLVDQANAANHYTTPPPERAELSNCNVDTHCIVTSYWTSCSCCLSCHDQCEHDVSLSSRIWYITS